MGRLEPAFYEEPTPMVRSPINSLIGFVLRKMVRGEKWRMIAVECPLQHQKICPRWFGTRAEITKNGFKVRRFDFPKKTVQNLGS